MTTMYLQCEIQKGNVRDVTWIEEKKAREGATAQVRFDGSDTWNEGWKITKVYNGKLSEAAVKAQRDAYRHHRKNTDI